MPKLKESNDVAIFKDYLLSIQQASDAVTDSKVFLTLFLAEGSAKKVIMDALELEGINLPAFRIRLSVKPEVMTVTIVGIEPDWRAVIKGLLKDIPGIDRLILIDTEGGTHHEF